MSEPKRGRSYSSFINPDRDRFYIIFIWGAVVALLAVLAVGLTRLLAVSGHIKVEDFLYTTQYGYYYFYALLSTLSLALVTVIYPKYVMFEELRSNRWYYLTRMGYSTASLVGRRLVNKLGVIAGTYVFGWLLGALLCMLFKITFFLNGLIALSLFGLVSLVLMLVCFLAISSLARKKLAVSLFAIVYTGLLAVYLYFNGCFEFESRRALATNISKLMYLDGASFLLLAGVLVILMITLIFTCARDRSAFAVPTEIGQKTLKQMGLEQDSAVALEGRAAVAESREVLDKKQAYKRQTMMVSLGDTQKVSATRTAELERGTRNKMSGSRIAAAVILIMLSLAAFCGAFVFSAVQKSEPQKPAKLLGLYAVRAQDDSFRDVDSGDVVIFAAAKDEPEIGRIALFQADGQQVYGRIIATTAMSVTAQTPSGEQLFFNDDIMAYYVGSVGVFNGVLKDTAPAVAVCAGLLLTGCVVLVLVCRKKNKK